MARCKSCQREIRWGKTRRGKAIPLERVSNVYTLDTDGEAHIVGHKGDVYISHFVTCPKANHWSGRGR